MTIRPSVPLATPEFADIKDSLKTYLRNVPELTDFDFEGSTLATLLDVLSYNSHFMAFYLNMVGNEAFLSTAIKRDSVVARAKTIGYTPRSARAAKASLSVTADVPTNQFMVVLPKGTTFTATSADEQFVFRTVEAYKLYRDSEYTADIDIYEVKPFTHKFTITSQIQTEGFVIPNTNVDTRFIKVKYSPDFSSEKVELKKSDSVMGITPDSEVFFVEESTANRHKIRFGDGVIGIRLPVGYQVEVEYYKTSGSIANTISTFSLNSSFDDIEDLTINSIVPAIGGADIESIQSIKEIAPKSYSAQGRSVNASDYEAIIKEFFPEIKGVRVWGGDKQIPAVYGKVFISMIPEEGYFVSQRTKDAIESKLTETNVITITPEVVDPDIIFVDVSTTVRYDQNKTSLAPNDLVDLIVTSLQDYNDTSLESFTGSLYDSSVSAIINDSDSAIISNTRTYTIRKVNSFQTGVPVDITINFGNRIEQGSFRAESFQNENVANCYFVDVAGIVKLFSLTTSGPKFIRNVGVVDYDNGVVTIEQFRFDQINEQQDFIDFFLGSRFLVSKATPVNPDIIPINNQVVLLNDIDVTVL